MSFESWLEVNKFYNKEEFIIQNMDELGISKEAAEKRWIQVEKQLLERYQTEMQPETQPEKK